MSNRKEEEKLNFWKNLQCRKAEAASEKCYELEAIHGFPGCSVFAIMEDKPLVMNKNIHCFSSQNKTLL